MWCDDGSGEGVRGESLYIYPTHHTNKIIKRVTFLLKVNKKIAVPVIIVERILKFYKKFIGFGLF